MFLVLSSASAIFKSAVKQFELFELFLSLNVHSGKFKVATMTLWTIWHFNFFLNLHCGRTLHLFYFKNSRYSKYGKIDWTELQIYTCELCLHFSQSVNNVSAQQSKLPEQNPNFFPRYGHSFNIYWNISETQLMSNLGCR